MSIKLKLSHELEKELSDEAAKLDLPLSEYIERLLIMGRPVSKMPVTGADLVLYWRDEEIIGSRSYIEDSQDRARRLRAQAELRVRE